MTNTVRHRFDVFGRLVDIERAGTGWRTYRVGNDGKRGPGGFVVPDDVAEADLAEYLFDLFHEEAALGRADIRRVS